MGARGLCHDWTEWKESWLEEKSDKLESRDSLRSGELRAKPFTFLEGGEVNSVSCGDAVTDPESRTSGRFRTSASCSSLCGTGARAK